MIEQQPILLTGIQRSGTSMIAGVLYACGAFVGDVAVKNNVKRGMFENIRIRDTIVKPYLESMKADRNGQWPLPKNIYVPITWRQRVEQVMKDEGYVDGPWLYKDTKMGAMWQVWNYAYPNAKWVIVRRRTGDVVQSCLKTGFMRAFKSEKLRQELGLKDEREGWLMWVHEYEKKFVEMIEEGVNCKVIWPERLLDGNFQQLYELLEWLGLRWDRGALDYINPLVGNERR